MRITLDEVKATASMARLHLSHSECTSMQQAMDQILTHAAEIEHVPVDGIEPTTHAVPMACPFRLDQVGAHLSVETALQNAPRKEASFFAVPTILSKEEG